MENKATNLFEKKERIKKEITSYLILPAIINQVDEDNPKISYGQILDPKLPQYVEVVNLDKLAEFLAKYINL